MQLNRFEKVFGYIVFFGACVGLAFLVNALTGSARAEASDTPAAPLGTPTAARQMTATVTPTATQNVALAASQTAVSLDAQRVANAAAEATIAAANAQATTQSGIVTATAIYNQSAATMQAKATYAAYEGTRAAIVLTMQAEQLAAENEARYGWMFYIAPWMIGLFLAAAAFIAAWGWATTTSHAKAVELVQAQTEAETAKAARLQRPAPAVRVITANDSGNIGRFDFLPCDNQQMTQIAQGIADGKTLAFNQWEGTGISRGTITAVRFWVVKVGLAIDSGNEIAINDKGREWFANWLTRSPTDEN